VHTAHATTVRAALHVLPQAADALSHAHELLLAKSNAMLHLSTRGDLGPLQDIELESTGLAAAILGGTVVASFIIFVLVRF
jgi:hypothetical protein